MSRAQKSFLFIIVLVIAGWVVWHYAIKPRLVMGGSLGGTSMSQKELLSADQMGRLLPTIADKAKASVVAIKASLVKESATPFGPTQRYHTQSLGSGILITRQGHIVTNAHIVNSADSIIVKLSGGAETPATLLGLDTLLDIAVLKIRARGLVPAKLADSDSTHAGQWVLALGNPMGLVNSVTFGIISATGREAPFTSETAVEYLQTDASINPGNSGGALINLDGEVVGMNTLIVSPTGENSGIGFAIPSNLLRFAVESILRHGAVVRGYLGVDIQAITPATAEAMQLSSTQGALVARVHPASPAAQAGLQPGDVILRFDKHAVATLHALTSRVAQTEPGRRVAVEFFRNGKSMTVTLELGRKGDPAPDRHKGFFKNKQPNHKSRRLGFSVIQDQRGDQNAVFVSDTEWDREATSPLPGDQLLKVNAVAVTVIADVKTAEKEIDKGDAVLLLLSRRGSLFYTSIRAK